jgi:hypothetical protein
MQQFVLECPTCLEVVQATERGFSDFTQRFSRRADCHTLRTPQRVCAGSHQETQASRIEDKQLLASPFVSVGFSSSCC